MKESSVGHPDKRDGEEPPTCWSVGNCWAFTAPGALTLSGGVPPAGCLHGQRRAAAHTCLPARTRTCSHALPAPALSSGPGFS